MSVPENKDAVVPRHFVAHVNYGPFSRKEPVRLKYETPLTDEQIRTVMSNFTARYCGFELCGIYGIYMFDAEENPRMQ